MKLEVPKHEDVNNIGGEFQSIEAGMDSKSLPFILDMLSKNFYSNPIGSIVREITSNCFDSHIEAKVEDAVLIKIEEDEEGDYISFNDFGVGLSPDRMKNIYMKWFTSTKRETNELIGGFGLGSKTPLAYTDYFYINTVFEGKKYNYLFSKGASLPTLDLLVEEATEQRNGTEVRIYIKNWNDRQRFISELKGQLCYFDNVWFEGCDIDNDYKIFETDLFKFRTKDQYSELMHICFGKVSYPIDWEQLGISPVKLAVGVKFDIGELIVTPNREALIYTNEVADIVRKRILLATEQIKNLYLSQQVLYEDFFEWFNNRTSRKCVTFGKTNEDEGYRLYLTGFDDLGKKFNLKIFQDLEIDNNIFGESDDPFSKLYYVDAELLNRKITKKLNRRHLTDQLSNMNHLFLYSEDSNYSQIKNYYHVTGNILRSYKTKQIFKNFKGSDFISYAPREKKRKEYYDDGGTWTAKYFNLGWSKKIYALIKYLRSQVENRVQKYHIDITEELKAEYYNYQRQFDLTLKRKLEEKIFCTNVSGYSDFDWKIDHIEHFTGIVIYGFLEDRKALKRAVTFMYLNPLFRNRELQYVDRYLFPNLKKWVYQQDGRINPHACKIIRIAKNNEKYFKNKPNMVHVNNLYGDNPLFRRLASSYKIENLLAEYISRHANFSKKYFFEQMSKINSNIGKALLDLKSYYELFTSEEDIQYTDISRSALKDEILKVAQRDNLFDPRIEAKIKVVEDFFKGVEILKYVEFSDETMPIVLKLLREKKKKINFEYYSNVVEPTFPGDQLRLDFEEKQPKTKFQIITNAA